MYVRCKKFENLSSGDAIIFRRIFSPSKQFYQERLLGIYAKQIETNCNEVLSSCANLSKARAQAASVSVEPWTDMESNKMETKQSGAFIFFVFLFRQLGGFEILLHFFSRTDLDFHKTETLKFTKRLIKALANMISAMRESQYKISVVPLIPSLIVQYQKMIESDSKLPNLVAQYKKHLINIVMSNKNKSRDFQSEVQMLQLNIVLKDISSSSLETKANGIKTLLNLFKVLEHKWPLSQLTEAEKLASLSLIQPVLKNKILEDIMAELDSHPELIEKCLEEDFFAFLYCWGALPKEHILFLWNLKKHPLVLKILKSVALRMNDADNRLLFSEIQAVPLGVYSEGFVQLISGLARNECLRNLKRIEKAQKPLEIPTITVNREAESRNSNSETAMADIETLKKISANAKLKGGSPDLAVSSTNQSSTGSQEFFVPIEDTPLRESPELGSLKFLFTLCHEKALVEGLALPLQALALSEIMEILKEYGGRFKKDIRLEYVFWAENLLFNDETLISVGKIFTRLVDSLSTPKAPSSTHRPPPPTNKKRSTLKAEF